MRECTLNQRSKEIISINRLAIMDLAGLNRLPSAEDTAEILLDLAARVLSNNFPRDQEVLRATIKDCIAWQNRDREESHNV